MLLKVKNNGAGFVAFLFLIARSFCGGYNTQLWQSFVLCSFMFFVCIVIAQFRFM